MTSLSESVSLPPSIVSLHRISPVRLQLGSASVISVQVQGQPLPWVSWFIGKNRVQSMNTNFRAEVVGDGRRHNLRVTKVTREMDEGVAVEARNDAGTDYRRIAIAICQDKQAEDVPRWTTSSTVVSPSDVAVGRTSGFDDELPVGAGRSNYSFTDDVFDELLSPGIPPLLLVQRKETIFPDEASKEILCPTVETTRDPATIETHQEKNLRTKGRDVTKSGRSCNNETVHSAAALEAFEGPTSGSAEPEIWKFDGIGLDSVCRDLLKESVPTEDDMDDLVSRNENWKPETTRWSNSSNAGAKSETEQNEDNERNILQASTTLGTTVTIKEAIAKKTSRLAKLKERIKKIKMLSPGRKQSNSDDRADSPTTIGLDLHHTVTNESQILLQESPRGKASNSSKKTPRRKSSTSAENGPMVEVIVPYSKEPNKSGMLTTVSQTSTDKRESPHQKNSKVYTAKNGLVEHQNKLAGSGDLSLAGYTTPATNIKYNKQQGKERRSSNDIQNENAITTDAKEKVESRDVVANKKAPQARVIGRQIELQTSRGGIPPVQLIPKDANVLESPDSSEIFDENRINLSCSSPPADEVERCRHRLSSSTSSQGQEKPSSSSSRLFQKRGNGSGTRRSARYSSSETESCGLASPTSPTDQHEDRNAGLSTMEPVETRMIYGGSVVERRIRAGPTPRSRSCQRPSSAERRSWIENARSVEIHVPRRTRSTSRTRWRSLSKEWDLVTVTTRTEETRTLPNATATSSARANAAVATADSRPAVLKNETKLRSTTTTATTKTEAKIEAQGKVFEAVKKSPKNRSKEISMESKQIATNSHPDRVVYSETQYSSIESNSTDAGEYVLPSFPIASHQEESLNRSDSQQKGTTPRRSRKDQSLLESIVTKTSSDERINKSLFDRRKQQAPKSSSLEFTQTSDLEKIQTKELDTAGAHETKAKDKISTAKRKPLGSVKTKDAELSKVGELLSDDSKSCDVNTEPRKDAEGVEFKADINETNPDMVELRFKVTEVNPGEKMVDISHDVDEVGHDDNSEKDETDRTRHSVEVKHDVNHMEETSESNRKLDEAPRKRHMVQVNHSSADKVVELDLELPEVDHGMVEISNAEVSELNEAVSRLSVEMSELNTNKVQLNSESVEPSDSTKAGEETSGKQRSSLLVTSHYSIGLTEEDDNFLGGNKRKTVSLDSEGLERNAEEIQFSSERTEMNDKADKLNRAVSQLNDEMVEFNSDNPERTVNVPSSNHETCEVNIALPKHSSSSSSSSSMVVQGKGKIPLVRTTSSITVTTKHSFFPSPNKKTLQKAYTSLDISGPNRDHPTIASDSKKDRKKHDDANHSSVKRISDSERHGSTHAADETWSTDDSVFDRGEYDLQTGKSEAWTDSEDVFERSTPDESVTPKVTSEVMHIVTDDADSTKSPTQDVMSEVTRDQQNEDVMTPIDSMTIEVMSGVSDDDDDTMASLTLDVMSDVSAAVTDDTKPCQLTTVETSKGISHLIIKPGDLLNVNQTLPDGSRTDSRSESGLSHEATSHEETDEDSYAIVDDNWKNSHDTCYAAMDVYHADEQDTCEEEDETSMSVEKILEYKQVEAETLESTRSKALDMDNGQNVRRSIGDDETPVVHVSSTVRSMDRDVLEDTTASQVTRDPERSIVENGSKENSVLLPDNKTKNSGADGNTEFPEIDDVHDYVTYIKSVFGARSLSSSTEEREVDTRHREDFGSLSDSAHLTESTAQHPTTKRTIAKLERKAAIDSQDLTKNEMNVKDPKNTGGTVEELASMAEMSADPAEAHLAVSVDSDSSRFKVPEDVGPGRAERKISVSSLVIRKPPYVRYATVEERTLGSTVAHPTRDIDHSAAVERDSKTLQRSDLQTEIMVIKPLTRSITLPGSITPQSQGDRKAGPTNRVTSLVEIVINSLELEHGKTVERLPRSALSELNLQIEKNYTLEGPHPARQDRTSSLSGIKLTEKNFALGGSGLAKQKRTLLSELKLLREKDFVLEGMNPASSNFTSFSEATFQTRKNVVLQGPHLARPIRKSLPEIKFITEKSYVIEGTDPPRQNPTSLSEVKFQTEKNFPLVGPHRTNPNLTSLCELKVHTAKDYVLEGLNLSRPIRKSLPEIIYKTEKNYTIDGLNPKRAHPTSVSEINFQKEKNFVLEDPNLARPNHTSLSELKLQTEKTFVLDGPPLPSQAPATKPTTANQTFRTILTIMGQSSSDDITEKQQGTGIVGKNKIPKLNNLPNEVSSLTVPTFIAALLDRKDEVDLTESSTATLEIGVNASDPKNYHSSKATETPQSEEEDNKVLLRSESVKWNPFRDSKVDNTGGNISPDTLTDSASETKRESLKTNNTQDDETVADEEYGVTSLDLNPVIPNNEQASKTKEDSDKFQENVTLVRTIKAGDFDAEESQLEQDIEFAETRYENETVEMISETKDEEFMDNYADDEASVEEETESGDFETTENAEMTSWHEDEIHFNQTTIIATNVQSVGEPESESSWKEESVEVQDKVEENESYVDIGETIYDSKIEENDGIIDELTAEVGSHVDQNVLVAGVENAEESESADESVSTWIETESESILRDEEEENVEEEKEEKEEKDEEEEEEEEAKEEEEEKRNSELNFDLTHYGKEVEEYNETTDEMMLEDGSQFDQRTVVTRVETEEEQETGESDKINWREEEEEVVYIVADEETEEHQEMEIEEHHDQSDELVFEVESRFDQVNAVTSEVELESGEVDETAWIEEETLDIVKDEEMDESRIVNASESYYDNETTDGLDRSHLHQAVVDTSVETDGEIRSLTFGNKPSCMEEKALENEEEERKEYIDITETVDDGESTEHHDTICEIIAIYAEESSREDELESGDVETSGGVEKISWEEREQEQEEVDMLRDKERIELINVIEGHDDNKPSEELIIEDEGLFVDHTAITTCVENEDEVKVIASGNADEISREGEEETADMSTGENGEATYEEVIEEHREATGELISEDENRFDEWTVVTKIETEVESKNENIDRIDGKAKKPLDISVNDDKEEDTERYSDIAETHYEKEIEEHRETSSERLSEDESRFEQWTVATKMETNIESENGNVDKIDWKEENPVDILLDDEGEEMERCDDTTEAHNEQEIDERRETNDESLSEDESRFEQWTVVTKVETNTLINDEEEKIERNVDTTGKAHNENKIEEQHEVTGELTSEDENRFEQWTVVTKIETNRLVSDEEEEIERDVDPTEVKNEKEIEEHHEATDERLSDDESRFEQWTVVTKVETNTLINDEEEEIERYDDPTENAHNENKIEEHHEVTGERLSEDENRFGEWTVATKIETNRLINDEEEKIEKYVDTTEAQNEIEIEEHRETSGELISEGETNFHQGTIVTSVEAESEWESGKVEETVWKAGVVVDALNDEEVEKSRGDYEKEITEEWMTEDGGHFDHAVIITIVEADEEYENGGKTTWAEGESDSNLRDEEEERNRYRDLAEELHNKEIEEQYTETIGETIGEMMPEDEGHFDEHTIFTEVGSDNETHWKEEETMETWTEEVTSGERILNQDSVAADVSDSSGNVEVTTNGSTQEDAQLDHETTTHDSEGGGNGELEVEHGIETGNLETLVASKEKSPSAQSPGEYQTIRSPVDSIDYESRSEEMSEKIWQTLEGQKVEKRKESSTTDSQGDEDYLESVRRSLSEKRWQEIERIRRNASEKALAEAQASANSNNNNGGKGFDFETWHRGFSVRKYQTINSTDKPTHPEVDDDETSRGSGDGKSQTVSEMETKNSPEKHRHPEDTEENEYESFSTGMHEEGWRTTTFNNEQSSANTNSKIIPAGGTDGADRSESQSDQDYMVTYEYGEMYSVFHHVPFTIETLRDSVLENFNSSPTMRRLLARYPSLRPGTWRWSSAVRDGPGQRPGDDTAADDDTRIKEVQHLDSVSVADQFTPQLMTEKFDTV